VTGQLLAFVALALVVIVTPGPDTALTIRNTISGGRRAGIGTAIGVRRAFDAVMGTLLVALGGRLAFERR
jgi:threonine/homoserine/homoserine lactone efflux protein